MTCELCTDLVLFVRESTRTLRPTTYPLVGGSKPHTHHVKIVCQLMKWFVVVLRAFEDKLSLAVWGAIDYFTVSICACCMSANVACYWRLSLRCKCICKFIVVFCRIPAVFVTINVRVQIFTICASPDLETGSSNWATGYGAIWVYSLNSSKWPLWHAPPKISRSTLGRALGHLKEPKQRY